MLDLADGGQVPELLTRLKAQHLPGWTALARSTLRWLNYNPYIGDDHADEHAQTQVLRLAAEGLHTE